MKGVLPNRLFSARAASKFRWEMTAFGVSAWFQVIHPENSSGTKVQVKAKAEARVKAKAEAQVKAESAASDSRIVSDSKRVTGSTNDSRTRSESDTGIGSTS